MADAITKLTHKGSLGTRALAMTDVTPSHLKATRRWEATLPDGTFVRVTLAVRTYRAGSINHLLARDPHWRNDSTWHAFVLYPTGVSATWDGPGYSSRHDDPTTASARRTATLESANLNDMNPDLWDATVGMYLSTLGVARDNTGALAMLPDDVLSGQAAPHPTVLAAALRLHRG